MDEKRWQRIEEVCGEALERPTGDRDAFVEEACGDDVALKEIVLSLIHYDERDPEFLEVPLVVPDDAQPAEGPLPERIGPFSVVRLLGRGGMGQVYLCERSGEGFRLRVAVKLIRRGLDADDVLRRFRIERRILASLNHPGIARFLDGGATEDGRPFFVMEYVDGVPLLDFCDRAASSVEARIRLFLSVCDAVEHAHKRLIVHRDLKPSNVLVTTEGTPKLLDFGVAKVLSDEDDWGPVEATRTGARLLTPQYASPEQMLGALVTTASDVYSLGVVLYELLSGHHPYAAGKETPGQLEAAVREEEPARPSLVVTRLETRPRPGGFVDTITPEDVSLHRDTTPERLRRSLSGDVDNIILKALRKDPERRYASAAALAEDLRRHLAKRPVLARPDTLSYRAGKFIGRNTVAVALAVTVVLTLLGATALSVVQARRVTRESERVAAERDKALEVQGFLLEAYGATSGDQTAPESMTVLAMLDRQVEQARSQYDDRPETRAELLHALAEAYDRLNLWAEAEPVAREALAIRTETLGDRHPDVARTLDLLGWILHQRRQMEEAEDLLRASVGIWREDGNDPGALSRALNDLGVLLSTAGRYDEAADVLEEALDIRRAVLGPLHRSVGITANNLAVVHSRMGDRAGAAELYGEAVRVLSEALGPDHQRVRVAKGNRATVLAAMGDLNAAEAAWIDVVAAQRRVGGRQFATGWALYQYGGTLTRMGRAAEAQGVLTESLPILEETAGMESGHYATATLFLGQALAAQGSREEGRALAAEALAIRKRVYGDVHIQVALGDESLAGLTSDPDEAVKLHREAVSVFEQALGPSNSRTLDSMLRLGQRLLDQRRYDEALDVYREARSRALEAPGDADLLERLEALEADIRAAEAGSEPPASRR